MILSTTVFRALYHRFGFSRKKRICVGDFRKYKSAEEGNSLIAASISNGTPFLVGRLGYIESNTVLNYLEIQKYKSANLTDRVDAFLAEFRSSWDPNVISLLQASAGVFPETEKQAEEFSAAYLDSIKASDMLGYFNDISGENYLRRNYCPEATAFYFEGLEPYRFQFPWSRMLKGKDVLVIHPFEETIKKQYKNRGWIFKDPNVLPEFNLKTLKAVQSMQESRVEFTCWSDALEDMKGKMESIKFDVCLVGAGAYGMPLCHYAKTLGKVAIYTGGATQILFGIRGSRWEKYIPEVAALFNNNWVRPCENEKPPGYNNMEGACYW